VAFAVLGTVAAEEPEVEGAAGDEDLVQGVYRLQS
jgi:hypothetical protein